MKTKLGPVHPGEVLLEDFMKPLALSAYKVAKDLGIPPIRITEIINGKRAISAETALLFGKYFGTSPEVWIRLQAQYDLETADPIIQKKAMALQPLKKILEQAFTTIEPRTQEGRGTLWPAVVAILEKSKKPLRTAEIYDALVQQGYQFNFKEAKKVLGIRLYKMQGVKPLGEGLYKAK